MDASVKVVVVQDENVMVLAPMVVVAGGVVTVKLDAVIVANPLPRPTEPTDFGANLAGVDPMS